MAATQCLISLIGVVPNKLTRSERQTLETFLLNFVVLELNQIFLEVQEIFPKSTGGVMIESNLISSLVRDILSTQAYNVSGVAYYTATTEDVIIELLLGNNKNPSFELSQRIIDLHITVRRDLYNNIFNKAAQLMPHLLI